MKNLILKALVELDRRYQWPDAELGEIIAEVSDAAAKAGLPSLVRQPCADADYTDVRRYLAECLAAQPVEKPKGLRVVGQLSGSA